MLRWLFENYMKRHQLPVFTHMMWFFPTLTEVWALHATHTKGSLCIENAMQRCHMPPYQVWRVHLYPACQYRFRTENVPSQLILRRISNIDAKSILKLEICKEGISAYVSKIFQFWFCFLTGWNCWKGLGSDQFFQSDIAFKLNGIRLACTITIQYIRQLKLKAEKHFESAARLEWSNIYFAIPVGKNTPFNKLQPPVGYRLSNSLKLSTHTEAPNSWFINNFVYIYSRLSGWPSITTTESLHVRRTGYQGN